jgi:hypothetical protein
MSDDPKVSGRYRELPREEPPRALDEAILAASRRAVHTGRRRWYFPVAAAAVIVLAVAVVAHVDRERPDAELATPPASVSEAPPQAPAAEERKAEQPKPARRAAKSANSQFTPDPRADSAAPAAAAPAPAAPAAEAERNDVGSASAGARVSRAEPPRPQSQMARASSEQGPEVELERIARLRAAGRDEEADRALAEFRKRYPDYRLSDLMKARVEKRSQ